MSVEALVRESDATELAIHVRKGDIMAAEAVEAAIAMAERINGTINAIAEPLFDSARQRAAKVDRKKPFCGVPFALKDLDMRLAGVPVHQGSRVPPIMAAESSPEVDKYLAAGLIPIATATTPEFGLRLVTETQAFGATRNPWNPQRTPGGSSGGSAALVAAGVVPVAHATDGGGSIRVPAACNGLVGLKPSRKEKLLATDQPASWYGLTVFHAVSRSVRDSAALLDITHGTGAFKANGALGPRGIYASAAGRAPGQLKLGVYRESPLDLEVSTETNAALDKAVALARDGGHTVEEIGLPIGRAFFRDFAYAVCAAMAAILHDEKARTGRDVLSAVERSTRTIARFGDILSDSEKLSALNRLNAAAETIIDATLGFDGVIMPLLAHPPVPVGAMDSRGLDDFLEEMLDRLHLARVLRIPALMNKLIDQSFWFTHWPAIQNVTGQPAIALPVHVTQDGLPLGIQIVGRPGGEEALLSLAAQMEKQSGWLKRRAPFVNTAPERRVAAPVKSR